MSSASKLKKSRDSVIQRAEWVAFSLVTYFLVLLFTVPMISTLSPVDVCDIEMKPSL
jgi:hypothetical protein